MFLKLILGTYGTVTRCPAKTLTMCLSAHWCSCTRCLASGWSIAPFWRLRTTSLAQGSSSKRLFELFATSLRWSVLHLLLYSYSILLLYVSPFNSMKHHWNEPLHSCIRSSHSSFPIASHDRHTFDRALKSLPITQHEKIWEIYLRFARECHVPETAVRVYRRYLQLEPHKVWGILEESIFIWKWNDRPYSNLYLFYSNFLLTARFLSLSLYIYMYIYLKFFSFYLFVAWRVRRVFDWSRVHSRCCRATSSYLWRWGLRIAAR